MLKKRFREYFTFTKKERNGIIVLLFILMILVALRIYQTNRSYGEIASMDEQFKKEIEEFEKSLVPKKEKQDVVTDEAKIEEDIEYDEVWHKPKELFSFDPNKISKNKLESLGFSSKQIETLYNYREKGGKFFKKKDLLKIYGVEQVQYDILEPYIVIEKEEVVYKDHKEVVKEKLIVEINHATINDLVKLKGIGESYANRIVKYRNLLGGFYSKNQLLEVYGLDSIKLTDIKEDILVDSSLIKKINLNESDYKDLVRHPYLNKYQTESILKYREIVGSFDQIEQIYLNNLLTKEEYLRLKPYLKLN